MLEFFIVLIFPVFVDILLIEIVLFWWNERRLYLPVPQVLPRKLFQPGMILNLAGAIQPETVSRLSLYHLVNKVGSFDGPALGDFVSLNLNLLSKDVVSDLLS